MAAHSVDRVMEEIKLKHTRTFIHNEKLQTAGFETGYVKNVEISLWG